MAQVIAEETRDGRRVLVYDSGLVKDAETGYIVRAAPEHQITTKEKSYELQRKRREKQRAAMDAALAAGVERQDFIDKFGEDAWIAAITESALIKATTPEDPKMIEAARFLRDWHNDLHNEVNQDGAGDNEPRFVVLLAELGRRRGDDPVIEGSVSDE